METLLSYVDVSKVWTNLVLFSTRFYEVFKKQHDELVSSDDWQIRLSLILVVCTLVNVVLIGIAWRVFGENVSSIFYNKPKSPVRRLENLDGSLSRSMEQLITKKIQ